MVGAVGKISAFRAQCPLNWKIQILTTDFDIFVVWKFFLQYSENWKHGDAAILP